MGFWELLGVLGVCVWRCWDFLEPKNHSGLYGKEVLED